MSGNGAGSCSLEQSLQEGAHLGQTKKCMRISFASGCVGPISIRKRKNAKNFGL